MLSVLSAPVDARVRVCDDNCVCVGGGYMWILELLNSTIWMLELLNSAIHTSWLAGTPFWEQSEQCGTAGCIWDRARVARVVAVFVIVRLCCLLAPCMSLTCHLLLSAVCCVQSMPNKSGTTQTLMILRPPHGP
jgi:hypothetical protein